MEQFNISNYLTMIPSFLTFFIYGAVVLSGLCVAVILLTSFFAQKENGLLTEQLAATQKALEVNKIKLDRLQKNYAQKKEFKNNLRLAELTTSLQKPRLIARKPVTDSSPPEKYRYLQSLAKKGMPADEIASVLAISTHEAQQLVTLSQIAQSNNGETDKIAA